MNITEEFNEKYYVVVEELLDAAKCKEATDRLFLLSKERRTTNDSQCPLSDAVYGDVYFEDRKSTRLNSSH